MPSNPLLTEEEKARACRILVGEFLASSSDEKAHDSPGHACNLVALYLAEACSGLKECESEFMQMKVIVEPLLSLAGGTNCVNGLPKCGNDMMEHYPKDLSSAVVAGEAIRIVKKLKLK